MQVVVIELSDGVDPQDAIAANKFVVEHLMRILPQGSGRTRFAGVPIRDRVGAMILLNISMQWMFKAGLMGSEPFETALDLYSAIGGSTQLTPVATQGELLAQLEGV